MSNTSADQPPLARDVTVCIPAYGVCPHLQTVISALNKQTALPAAIVVAHSGEGNPAETLLSRQIPLQVVHSDQRWFAGKARNRAAGQAVTDWLVFLDADVRPVPAWLDRLLQAVPAYGARSIIGGSIGVAEAGGYWGMALWLAEFSSHHSYVPSAKRHAIGSFTTLVARDFFQEVGGYPEAYQTSQDVAFASKVRAHGGAVVYHQGPLVEHFNVAGFTHFLQHSKVLGKGGAAVRRAYDLPGSSAARFPPLAFGLGLLRLIKVTGRVVVYGKGIRTLALILAPGVLIHIAIWSWCFFLTAWSLRRNRDWADLGH